VAAMKADGPTKAAFLLIPRERLVSAAENAGTITIGHYIKALETNGWEFLLNMSSLYRTEVEFVQFANFLPKLARGDTMDMLRWLNYDRAPLFVEACQFKPIPYKILCQNTKLIKGDIWELIHMRGKDGEMVFPKKLEANVIKSVLSNMTQYKKMKLFNEYIGGDQKIKSFFYLDTKGVVQQTELGKMGPDAALDFLISPVNQDASGDYVGASVFATLGFREDNAGAMQFVLDMPWSPNQLTGLCKAPAEYGSWVFFTWDDETKRNVLAKLPPKFRNRIIFSEQGLQYMENDTDNKYIGMLQNAHLIAGTTAEYRKIKKYFENNVRKKHDRQRAAVDKEKQEAARRARSFAGNFSTLVHGALIQDVMKSRVRKK